MKTFEEWLQANADAKRRAEIQAMLIVEKVLDEYRARTAHAEQVAQGLIDRVYKNFNNYNKG